MANVLVVDDEKSIRVTFTVFLEGAGHCVRTAATVAEARERLAADAGDVVVCDLLLHGGNGLDVLDHVRATCPQVEVILMTGEPTLAAASAAVKAHAFAYLGKPVSKQTLLEAVAAAAAAKAHADEYERVQQENRRYREDLESLIASRTAELRAVYDSAPVLMCTLDADRRVLHANRAFTEFTGASESELQAGRACGVFGCINALDDPRGCGFGPRCAECQVLRAIEDSFRTGREHRDIEWRATVAREGRRREVVLLGATARIKAAGQSTLLLCLQDVTARKQMEAQLLQTQRTEAVGQLAAGFAHEFNNVLMGIVGFAHHLCDHVEPGTPAKHYLQRIQELADRATMVASGLLTFSRQHTREPRDVVVDQLLGRVCPMWAELVGEDSRFDFTLNSDGAVVHVDPGQMEQALLNLVLNAREAMPQRGDLTIASRRAAPEGPVLITVRDTGVGMDGETLKRAFEPFFTTKPPDKGGGLGLPVVHGIVTAHGGTVAIESAPGKGTTVTISLPLARGAG